MNKLNYTPAVYKEVGKRCYIEYYQWHPIKKRKERHRITFDLGRIKDLKERKKKANIIIKEINMRLPTGYPYEALANEVEELSLIDGLILARKIKLKTDRVSTRNSYSSVINRLILWVEDNRISQLPLKLFNRRLAIKYMDWLEDEKGLQAIAYNNNINIIKTAFNALVDREYISKNPFSGLNKKRTTGKKRRSLLKDEAEKIIKRARAKNEFLYLAIMLQHKCFIRPNELRFLKPYMFDFQKSIINIPGSIAKNKMSKPVTIPNDIKGKLEALIKPISSNSYIFGSKLKPSVTKPCSKNYMARMHREIVQELWREGLLTQIEGITFYSWKDTGGSSYLAKGVPVTEVMSQMRHKDLSYTQRYCNSIHMVNTKILETTEELFI